MKKDDMDEAADVIQLIMMTNVFTAMIVVLMIIAVLMLEKGYQNDQTLSLVKVVTEMGVILIVTVTASFFILRKVYKKLKERKD